MTYSNDRVCWDADSHLMPRPDFMSRHADAKHRDALVINGGKNGGAGFEKWFGKIVKDVDERRADPERTQALEQNVIASAKGWAAHGAVYPDERSQTLDLLGFEGQLVFSTFCGSFLSAAEPDLMYAGTRAHTRAMTEFCEGDERLLPVALIPLNDADCAIRELDFALEVGASAIHVPSDAPGGNHAGRSPAHADLDPFWARLAEARVPMVLHIGGGKLLPKAYHNNGRPQPTDWLGGGENLRAKDWPATHHSPENFLTSMILDGLFDRHPELKCGVIELGAAWVPGFLRNLDAAFNSFRKNEPLLQALSMMPSEFVQRQVRFTPFVFEDTGWLIEQGGESLFLFSSDYPHPEGGRNPIKRFDESLEASKISESARSRFYEHNFKDLLGIA